MTVIDVVIIPSQQQLRGYFNAAVRVKLGEWMCASVLASVALCLVGTIQTAVLVRSLSIFTCKLLVMNRGILLILSHRVKGQGQF